MRRWNRQIRLSLLAVLVIVGGVPGWISQATVHAAPAPASGWQVVGHAGLSDSEVNTVSMAVYGEAPIVAYYDEQAYIDNWTYYEKLHVKMYDHNEWVDLGTVNDQASMGTKSFPYISVFQGEPYVAYPDPQEEYRVTVKKYDGTGWTVVGASGFSDSAVGAIHLQSDGESLYLAADLVNEAVTVYQLKDGNWAEWDGRFSPGGPLDYLSMAVFDDTPHIAYSVMNMQTYERTIFAKKYNHATEQWEDLDFPTDNLTSPKLAFDRNGHLYMAYLAEGFLRVSQYDAPGWSPIGEDSISGIYANFIDFKIDGETLYLAGSFALDNWKASVLKFNGSSWISVGDGGFSEGYANYSSFAMINGSPHLAFQDGANEKKATVMKYVPALTPPNLVADADLYDGGGIDLTFEDDSQWRQAIRQVKLRPVSGDADRWNEVALSQYEVTSGQISISLIYVSGAIEDEELGDYEIVVSADGYEDAAVTQNFYKTELKPDDLTAVAGDGKVDLSWEAVAGVSGYEIVGASDPTLLSPSLWIEVDGATLTYADTGLTNGETRYYVVRAIFGGLIYADFTGPVSATPNKPASDPSRSSGGSAAPSEETITVNVEDGGTSGIVSKVEISRSTKADGSKKDVVNFNASKAKETIGSILEAGSKTANIIIPDAKDEVSEVNVTLSKDAGKLIADAQIDLGISTDNVKVHIPNSSLAGFDDDLYFHFIPIKKEEEKQEVKRRAERETIVRIVAGDQEVTVVGRPMTIETNMQSRPVTLTMPLGDVKLSEAEMANLGIYIEHSDGTKELLRGVLVPFNDNGDLGLQFTVNKFSTFTLVHIDGLAADGAEDQVHSPYMMGYEDGTFRPEKNITRAEMAAILARTIDRATSGASQTYPDVSAKHWASEAIARVTAMGLMQGYEDGTFGTEQPITRAEMATLAAVLASDSAQAAGAGFTDIQGHWAEANIRKAQGAQWISGYEDGTFRPDESLTRAEAVVIMNKLLKRGPEPASVKLSWTDVSDSHWAAAAIAEASIEHAYRIDAEGMESWAESR